MGDPTRRGPALTTPDPDQTAATAIARQGTAGVRQEAATRWLAGELEAMAELVDAARLTLRAGHVPVVHVRRLAVRAVALDAALGETEAAGT